MSTHNVIKLLKHIHAIIVYVGMVCFLDLVRKNIKKAKICIFLLKIVFFHLKKWPIFVATGHKVSGVLQICSNSCIQSSYKFVWFTFCFFIRKNIKKLKTYIFLLKNWLFYLKKWPIFVAPGRKIPKVFQSWLHTSILLSQILIWFIFLSFTQKYI